MKKLLLIATTCIVFASCAKDVATPQTEEQLRPAPTEAGQSKDISTTATIKYLGDIATDGKGWVLMTGENSYEIPTNLSEEFKQEDLPVNVTYRITDQVFPCRCADKKMMVEIITIDQAK